MNSVLGAMFTVIAVAALATLLALALTVPTSPLRIRRHAAAEVEAPRLEPEPLPKIPRDTSRPYPRPKGSRSKLNRVCPVCGTGRETGDLDRRVLGWPAHRTCAEWLGDWEPVVRGGGEYASEPAHTVARAGSATTIHYNGSVTAAMGGGAGGSSTNNIAFASPETMAITEQVKNGLITVNEARERLDREIVALWGVPPVVLQEHTHKVGDPLPAERCPKCGAQFVGTPDYLRMAFKMHQQVGCRQSSSSLPA